jgi:hypothetical protein
VVHRLRVPYRVLSQRSYKEIKRQRAEGKINK